MMVFGINTAWYLLERSSVPVSCGMSQVQGLNLAITCYQLHFFCYVRVRFFIPFIFFSADFNSL